MKRITEINELTPIEEYKNILYKRDDLYLPYSELPNLGGGKVRQMQTLYSEIKTAHGEIEGLITNPVSLSSPQSAIVAKVSKDNNLPCIICVGGKIASVQNTIQKYKPLSLAFRLGAEIRVVANIGYSNVIRSKMNDISKSNNYHFIDFGINLIDYPEAIIGSTAKQVQNLPNKLDNLIIPCGSALTMAGILVGLNLYNKQVKRIIGIQISGIDRRKNIDEVLKSFGIKTIYEFYIDKTYKYSKNLKYFIDSNLELNVKYESKAVLYFNKYKNELNIRNTESTMIWIIGNNNFLF